MRGQDRSLGDLIDEASHLPACHVLPPSGLPAVAAPYRMPPDVLAFYERCGGMRLFSQSDYPVTIVAPHLVTRSNPVIVGADCPDDLTDSWHIIAHGTGNERLSIDCHDARCGRCYESFWDTHGVAGSCPIVALSFTELLRRLVDARGGYWYWLRDDFEGYGDAYGSSWRR